MQKTVKSAFHLKKQPAKLRNYFNKIVSKNNVKIYN